MWAKIVERKFDDLFVYPKPTIIIIHPFRSRRIAIGVDVPGRNWEQLAWAIPFMNSPDGRFDCEWRPLWQGTRILTFPKEDLKGCSLEIKPRYSVKSITVRVYESFLTDEFSI
jgi:hypothetical protein